MIHSSDNDFNSFIFIISLMGRLFRWLDISFKRNKSALFSNVLEQTLTFQLNEGDCLNQCGKSKLV